jgi:hypothetical protein
MAALVRTDELKTLQAQLDAERAANDAKREKLERQLMPATGLDSSLLERASIYSKEGKATSKRYNISVSH